MHGKKSPELENSGQRFVSYYLGQ